jgi:hypothetical protein
LGGIIKYFRFGWDELLWEISFANLIMLVSSVPSTKDKTDEEEKGEEITLEQMVSIANKK